MTKSEQLLTKSYKQPRNFDITVIMSQKWLIENVVSSFQDVLETLMMNSGQNSGQLEFRFHLLSAKSRKKFAKHRKKDPKSYDSRS